MQKHLRINEYKIKNISEVLGMYYGSWRHMLLIVSLPLDLSVLRGNTSEVGQGRPVTWGHASFKRRTNCLRGHSSVSLMKREKRKVSIIFAAQNVKLS